jgi:malate synthase
VAHPDLVPVAQQAFDEVLAGRPNQKGKSREDVKPDAESLLKVNIPGGKNTEAGVRADVKVAMEYIENWLEGRGAVGIDNLMEDSATAEISRMQLQQWVKQEVRLDDGQPLTRARYGRIREEELSGLLAERKDHGKLKEASELLDRLVDQPVPEEFLTLGAYEFLE